MFLPLFPPTIQVTVLCTTMSSLSYNETFQHVSDKINDRKQWGNLFYHGKKSKCTVDWGLGGQGGKQHFIDCTVCCIPTGFIYWLININYIRSPASLENPSQQGVSTWGSVSSSKFLTNWALECVICNFWQTNSLILKFWQKNSVILNILQKIASTNAKWQKSHIIC